MQRWVPVALLLVFAMAFAKTEVVPFRGRVMHVSDGDSIVVRVSGGRSVKVRISAIDAPEKGQAYSTQARQSLRALTGGAELEIVPRDVDRYG
ncbi:MAG: nuclease, partial [Thermoanaerobaculia bacterium]